MLAIPSHSVAFQPSAVEGPLSGVRITHLGHFDPQYSRNRIVGKALQRAGADLELISDDRRFLARTPHLVREVVGGRRKPDVVLVGFPGHADVPVARFATRFTTPVIFDAFISLYEMSVEDREVVKPGTARARALALEDRVSCTSATRVLLDTQAHIDYFVERFRLPRGRFRRLWVGADDDIVRPQPIPTNRQFRVFVYTSFIPLHGLEHVIRAASLLEASREDVMFDVVGGGLTEPAVRGLADELQVRNVEFHGRLPYAALADAMAASDVCLGIFGTSPKADRVIPNKVFDALATARPVITADTSAAREVLEHGTTAVLCPPGDAEALATAITSMMHDPALRARLAAQGHELFVSEFSIDALARQLAPIVSEVLA